MKEQPESGPRARNTDRSAWDRAIRRVSISVVALLILGHDLCCRFTPNLQWAGPAITGVIAFVCGVYAASQTQLASRAERRSWFIMAILFAVWGAAWAAVSALSKAIVTPWPTVHLDNILMAARIAPLMLLLAAEDDEGGDRIIALFDHAQIALSIVTMMLFFFPALIGARDQDFAMAMVYRNAVNVALLSLGLFNLAAWRRSPLRRVRFSLSLLVILYTLAALYINVDIIRIDRANPLSLYVYTLLDWPFLIFLLAAGRLRPGSAGADSGFGIRYVGPSLMAVIVTACAIVLANQSVALGMSVSFLSIVIYGTRSSYTSFIQRRQLHLDASVARQKVAFLTDMNHEIRSPLSNIALSSALLARHSVSPEQSASLIRSIHRSSEKVIGMLRDMLEISRIDAGLLSVKPENCNPAEVILRACEEVRSFARESGVEFGVVEPLPSVLLFADRGRLQQILVNLLVNAVRNTPTGGRVTIGARRMDGDDPVLRIEVCDTGVGIAPEDQKVIFQRYKQGPAPVHGETGSGLGLSISADLARLMGASLHVTSQTGSGSLFWIALPLRTDDKAKDKTQALPA